MCLCNYLCVLCVGCKLRGMWACIILGAGAYDYTRSGNPTRDVLQSLMAKLEKAHSAFCFIRGMAALTTVTKLVEPGQEIVTGDDIYIWWF